MNQLVSSLGSASLYPNPPCILARRKVVDQGTPYKNQPCRSFKKPRRSRRCKRATHVTMFNDFTFVTYQDIEPHSRRTRLRRACGECRNKKVRARTPFSSARLSCFHQRRCHHQKRSSLTGQPDATQGLVFTESLKMYKSKSARTSTQSVEMQSTTAIPEARPVPDLESTTSRAQRSI